MTHIVHFFASYQTEHESCPESELRMLEHTHGYSILHTAYTIISDGDEIGTIYLEYNMANDHLAFAQKGLIALGLIALSLLLAYVLAGRIQKLISEPIIQLAESANRISDDKDYSVRIEQTTYDETGKLVSAFNHMIESISKNETELITAKKQAEEANRLKSEFLANMSHELRTPLNSLLILSECLADNDEGNLTQEQLEDLHTIHGSGKDLLELINDILDLAKVESGKMELHLEEVLVERIVGNIEAQFKPLASEKNLSLTAAVDPDMPQFIHSDGNRLAQILRNFLSNAFKFTHEGGVTVQLFTQENQFGLAVSDTGIGIPEDKQEIIFSTFQQADGSTSREYGGTGLGLSISRELATLLGGKITLESTEGHGSTFTLYLPKASDAAIPPVATEHRLEVPLVRATDDQTLNEFSHIADDRTTIKPGDRIVLVIEDDPKFAKILREKIHEYGYKCLVAHKGVSGLELVERYKPNVLILDIELPDISGIDVKERLKKNPATTDIPIYLISVNDSISALMEESNVIGYMVKPISASQLERVFEQIRSELSLDAPSDLTVTDAPEVPHTNIVPPDLQDDTQAITPRDPEKERIIISNKKILIVDDDGRNIFALSRLLRKSELKLHTAQNGQQAVDFLQKNPDTDLVLMDVMMPVMNGLEATKTLRTQEQFSDLPIIAVTAKAMNDDADKCLEAGMNDYLSKPVDKEQLLEMLEKYLNDPEESKAV